MTKKLLRSLAIFAFSCFFSLSASCIGNLADPAILDEGFWISDCSFSSVRLGLGADLLFSKRMRPLESDPNRSIAKTELNWTLAICDVGWNVKERFDFHLLAGPVSSVELRWQEPGLVFKALGNRGLFWGASSKLILLEMQDTALGIDFHGGGIEWIRGSFLRNEVPQPESLSSRLYFWQLSGGLSQNLGFLRPYIGGVSSHLVYVLKSGGSLRFQDYLAAGIFEGCSMSLGAKVLLNIEARQFFESGVSLSGEIRF